MSSPAVISSQIVEIITHTPDQKILGTRLADQLRRVTEFDPAIHGKLGLFITRHAPLVQRLERKGGDWYYGLRTMSPNQDNLPFSEKIPESRTPPNEPGALERLSGPAWKTFVSPHSRHRLMGNPQTGKLTVVSPGMPLPESPWIPVPSCSVSQHADIAKAFVAQLGDTACRSSLEDIIASAGSGPDSGFHEKVRELGLGLEWSPFRRAKIIEILASSLKSLGITFQEVVDFNWKGNKVETPQFHPKPPEPSVNYRSEQIDVQRIVAAAVVKMSNSELRQLPIPLGYILDVLVNR
jgi:hypothetical protein